MVSRTNDDKSFIPKLTPEQKLLAALNLYHSAKKLKAAALRAKYPTWSEEEIQKKVKKIFMYARD